MKLLLFRPVVVAAMLIAPSVAVAAGMYLSPRGVRPLARGGAFVAGADDVNALSYNPAGLGFAGSTVLLDASLPFHTTEYERRVYAESAPLEPVKGQAFKVPLPTMGVTYELASVAGLTLGAGLVAEYGNLQNWPSSTKSGGPAPQRYAILNYKGTAVEKAIIGAAYRISELCTVGLTVQAMVGSFTSEVVTSSCDGYFCTQPENPEYDSVTQMRAKNVFIPAAQVGIIVTPQSWLRLGLAIESGYHVDEEVSLRVRLPTTAVFADATIDQEDSRARVRLELPMSMRMGAELRPNERARLELALVYEPWSVHDRVEVESEDLVVHNVVGMGDYAMKTVVVDRGFRDSFSVRLGGELALDSIAAGLTARGGMCLERSAVAPQSLTPMTVDLNKVITSLGAAYRVGAITLEATYAHIFMPAVTVTDGAILQPNPARPPYPGRTPIGNGTYQSKADIVGAGARLDW